jgi:nuclear cap-binding protein subunit 1
LATSKHFIHSLLPDGDGGLRTVLKLLDAGEEGWWSTRAKYGWFREFVRRYQGYLGELKSVVERDVLAGMGSERGEVMIRELWSNIGQGG